MEPILRSVTYSRYSQRIMHAQPELAGLVTQACVAPLSRTDMAHRLATLLSMDAARPPEAQLKSALRQLRTEVFCTVMERDLAGTADLTEVTGAMSDLAELTIQCSLSVLNAELETLYGVPYGAHDPLPQTLGVVGMGKLGGYELNVSSDIDLIFVYADEGETTGGERSPISSHEYFSKLGKKLIGALSEFTADGYVFRVDMRLRPNGEAGPLVCSLPMLEEYFYVQGREWERYAWIKSRLVSETESDSAKHLAAQLDALVQPFVYRRYLDFGVIDAVRALHAQIRREAMRRASMRPDKADDIKLGRGGIREIEFCAQVFQLIRGGQDAGFRVRPTLQALAYAASQGLLAPAAATQLAEAYGFLRQLEHRLQYADDAQTHVLPVAESERARLAASLGFAHYAALRQTLDGHLSNVERQFNQIFADKNDTHYGLSSTANRATHPMPAAITGVAETVSTITADATAQSMAAAEAAALVWSEALDDENTPQLLEYIVALGFNSPAKVLSRLTTVWRSVRHTSLPEKSRMRFDLLIERALHSMHELAAKRRDETLLRFLDLLEAINRRGAYLALLTEYPAALARVLSTLGASRWAADYLCSHPQLLDELLDDELLVSTFDWPAFKAALAARLAAADGVEQQMDLLRHAHHAELFRILLLDLAGHMTLEHVSDRLSELADAMLDVTLEAVWQQVPRRHCAIPRFAVIAYGKLGGKELAYGSDLDLIFLYDDPDEAAPEIYLSFARRLISWLTSSTGAGQLFDIDLRLRPDGASGLLVTDLNAFRRYQLREGGAANAAWMWEHQALTRARYCAGDARIGAAFEAIRTQVLILPRAATTLAQEIVAMRARVLEGHPNSTPLFDLKHDRGGMVDIEFMVQYFVLLYAGSCPELIRNTGNIALLRTAAGYAAITASEADAVGNAYRFYRVWQHRLQLDGIEQHMRVSAEQAQTQREAVLALWARVFKNAA